MRMIGKKYFARIGKQTKNSEEPKKSFDVNLKTAIFSNRIVFQTVLYACEKYFINAPVHSIYCFKNAEVAMRANLLWLADKLHLIDLQVR